MKRQNSALWAFPLTCCMLVGTVLADKPGPLTLDEIRQFKDDGTKLVEIVKKIDDRGISFEIDKDATKALRKLGFSRKLLARLRKRSVEAAEAEPLDPAKDAEYERFAERIRKILERSQTGATIVHGKHITIICDKSVRPQAAKVVERMEQLLDKRFPGRLGTGPDRRVANIALFATRYNYQKWIRAMFAVYESEGFEFEGMNALERAQRTERYLVEGIFNCCLEKMTPQAARHTVAYAIGHHYLTRLTENKAPAPLATGFGNVAEVMLLNMPTMMLNSGYSDRNLGGGRNRWLMIIRQRFAQNLVPPIERVLEYKTSSMKLPQYAECWSLAAYLAESEKAFAGLVDDLRDGMPARLAIEKNYDATLKELHKRWQKWAT